MSRASILTATVLAIPAVVAAQPAPYVDPSTRVPAARPADVATLDGLIGAVYDVISGPAGQKRDWDRMRSLFLPGARLIPTGRNQQGEGRQRVLTLEDYITGSGAQLERNGFFEREIGRRTDRYGNIVQVFSAYDSRRTAADTVPFARGINSMQAWYDGKRWWMVTIFWQGESAETPIPEQYLRRTP